MTAQARYAVFAITGRRIRRPRRNLSNRRGPARNWRYLAWIREQPECCCGCGRGPCQAAHTGSDGGTALKASDYSCVPLYWECHREYDNGLESKGLFEQARGISMVEIVRDLNRAWFGAEDSSIDGSAGQGAKSLAERGPRSRALAGLASLPAPGPGCEIHGSTPAIGPFGLQL